MDVNVNTLKAAAAFADAVTLGLQRLEENRPIELTVELRGIEPRQPGPVDEMCEEGVTRPAEITTLNALWQTQERLARLLHRLAGDIRKP
jgi:hypothetical protein